MNSFIENLNAWAEPALTFAWPMFWQSSLLIAVVFTLDFLLRRKVRAHVRYFLWLVVLIKVLLPPSLALPTSVAWWFRPSAPVPAAPQPAPLSTWIVTHSAEIAPANLPILAATMAAEPASALMSGKAWVLVSWGMISAGLFLGLTLRWRQVTRQAGRTIPPFSASNELVSLAALFENARRAAGVRRGVRLRFVDRAMSPAVFGLFRPVILLPLALVRQLSPAQLSAVLLHELIHLRRRDVWVNCFQALLQIVYWWHPLLWFANARIRRLREEAVDDAVMIALRDESDVYAPTLVEVAKLAFRRPLTMLGLVGILESRRGLRQRIERLVNFKTPGRAGLSIVSLLGIATFTALAVPMGEAPAGTPTSVAVNHPAVPSPAGPAARALESLLVEFRADSETYDPQTGTAHLRGNVMIRIKRDGATLTADSVTIDTREGKAIADGNVIHRAPRTGFVLFDAPTPAAGPVHLNLKSEIVHDGRARQAIIAKLSELRIEQVVCEHEPLSNVLARVGREIRTRDSSLFRVNIVAPTWDIGAVPVTIQPALTNARLLDVLDAIVKGTDKPIQYVLHDYGVVFSSKETETGQLRVRNFRINPARFNEGLVSVTGLDPTHLSRIASGDHDRDRPAGIIVVPRGMVSESQVEAANAQGLKFVTRTNGMTEVHTAMIEFFAAVGVDLSPQTGKNVFYSDSRGTLVVRATQQDLDLIEAAIQTLALGDPSDPWGSLQPILTNASGFAYTSASQTPASGSDAQPRNQLSTKVSPRQIHIKSWFFEISPGDTRALSFLREHLPGSSPTNSGLAGILTAPQFDVVLRDLQQSGHAKAVAEPRLLLTLGQPAQLKHARILPVATHFNPKATQPPGIVPPRDNVIYESSHSNLLYELTPMEFGKVLDITARSSEEDAIDLDITVSLSQFLGYKAETNSIRVYVNGKEQSAFVPVPDIRQSKVTSRATVWDGQTLVLEGLAGELPALSGFPGVSPLFPRDDRKGIGKNVIIFITPTIVDAAAIRIPPR